MSFLVTILSQACDPGLEPPPPPAATREGRWVQDIDYLAEQLPRLHPSLHANLFFQTSRADFDRAVDEARQAVPTRQDHEVAVSLLRIAALPGDAHTNVGLPATFRRLPLQFTRFPDGLYVVQAEASLADALGARVFRLIEGADPASVTPDLPVSPTIRDYREGRDPLLQAALDSSP